MEGVSIIETKTLEALIAKIDVIQNIVEEHSKNNSTYMTIDEVSKMVGFTKVWVINNKEHIGYSSIGRSIRFKRKDVEEFIEANYFKTKIRRK